MLTDTLIRGRMASFGGEADDSMTSLLNDEDHGTDVICLGWQDFATQTDFSRVSLVKMDIEGAEFDVLPHLIPCLVSRDGTGARGFPAAAQRAEIGRPPVQSDQPKQAFDEAGRLSRRHSERDFHGQAGLGSRHC